MNKIRHTILACSAALHRLLDAAAMIFLAIMVMAVLYQVIARYIFDQPPVWTEEAARYAMVWFGLAGATLSFRIRLDPALMTGVSAMPAILQLVSAMVRGACILLFLVPVIWYSFIGANMNVKRAFLTRHWNSEAYTFDMSTFWVAIGVPIFASVILIHALARIAEGKTSKSVSEKEK